MTRLIFSMIVLVGCGGAADPCDTLCEDAGFSGIDATSDGCFCSAGGLGGSLTVEACDTYCADVHGSADDARLETTTTLDDSCVCAP